MHVEFFGIPRERAGVAELELDVVTLGDALAAIAARFPALRDLIGAGCLHSSVAANLNGDVFIRDPNTTLGANDRVILLSSDAGG